MTLDLPTAKPAMMGAAIIEAATPPVIARFRLCLDAPSNR